MKCGITGLPNVGKSTLFNALSKTAAEVANYPFCTIEPNHAVVAVPDARLDFLNGLYNAEKYTPACIEFVDIAGLVKGASRGEGLGNKFLSNIRECDALLHVVRCFEDPNIIHVDGAPNPLRDVETINIELIFSDLEYLERRIDKVSKMSKSGDKRIKAELDFLTSLAEHLTSGKSARSFSTTPEEREEFMRDLFLLTLKPVLYVANISESDITTENEALADLTRMAAEEGAVVLPISARIEAELAALDDDERAVFLEELGLSESGLHRIIRSAYDLLGLISYLTAGPKEVRAWTIPRGCKAAQAAGKIHSDFERGFIRAEIVAYADLERLGSMAAAKEKGLVRSEGRDYVMQDGDVTLFRFNV